MGLGGGVMMVPYMTIFLGMDIKEAVPVSLIAVAVGALSASTAYLKKSMVDSELVVIISIFMVIGSVMGSFLSALISSAVLQMLFSVVVLCAGIMMLLKKENQKPAIHRGHGHVYFILAGAIALAVGVLGSLVGLGGGLFIIPVLYLLFGLSIDTARGTSALTIGFAAAAASIIYFFNGQLDPIAAAPVMLGVAVGGMVGGHFGTVAKPMVVKILFFVIMLYIAYKLGYEGIKNLL